MKEIDKIRENWEVANGEPYLFIPINYRYTAIFPTPSALGSVTANEVMYTFYKARADTLTGTSEPIIPFNNQECTLRGYTTADMFEQAEEWTKAQAFMTDYWIEIEQIRKWVRERDKERLSRLGGSL